MFQEVTGDFWIEAEEQKADAIVCTINTVLKKDKRLVMGAGIALQFADRFDWLSDRWGCRTIALSPRGTATPMKRTYPFVEPIDHGTFTPALVGIHTKYDWKDPSPFSLVDRSIKQLYIIAQALNWKKVIMTRPGCGHGGLHWERQVKPLMEQVLDERFVVVNDG